MSEKSLEGFEEIGPEEFWKKMKKEGGMIGMNRNNAIEFLFGVFLSETNISLEKPENLGDEEKKEIFEQYDFVLVVESEEAEEDER